jgi:hypothetical protein
MRVRSISGSFEGGCGEGGRDGWPRGETPGDGAKGDFLEGTRSLRPRGKAGRKPKHNVITKGQRNTRWPNGDMPRVKSASSLRACGARPSEGRAIQGKMA